MNNQLKSKFSIFKPGVLFLLVFTGIVAMVIAGGLSIPATFALTLAFGALAAGAANILNNYIDRDIDRVMERTKGRPIPAGRIKPSSALVAGSVLAMVSVVLFWFFVNQLSAVLTLCGILFYVLVYSAFLKKRTEQNIVLGGLAGIFPALVGWAAITGTLTITPLLIGLLIVFWTPPHFWALAIVYRSDYKRARIPMLPSVMGVKETSKQIVMYSLILIAFTILLGLLGDFSSIYLGSAVVLGMVLLFLSFALVKTNETADARLLFQYSIIYLIVIFIAMIADKMSL
jgi:protoheme IX farnesyltransferase